MAAAHVTVIARPLGAESVTGNDESGPGKTLPSTTAAASPIDSAGGASLSMIVMVRSGFAIVPRLGATLNFRVSSSSSSTSSSTGTETLPVVVPGCNTSAPVVAV